MKRIETHHVASFNRWRDRLDDFGEWRNVPLDELVAWITANIPVHDLYDDAEMRNAVAAQYEPDELFDAEALKRAAHEFELFDIFTPDEAFREVMRVSGTAVSIHVWDNGGDTIDRYIIAITGIQEINSIPYAIWIHSGADPRVFWQHNGETPLAEFAPGDYDHLGKRVTLGSLPSNVQRRILDEILVEA